MDKAVTPSTALSAISGPACRKARVAAPGTRSAPRSRRSPSARCGATPRRAICPAPTTRSTGSSCSSWSSPIAAGFTINLSADNPAQADQLADLKIGPVVTILGRDYARRAVRHRSKGRPDEWSETIAEWRDRIAALPRHTPAGRRIAICPATYSAATCASCGACAEPRGAVIGFPAPGAWRMVEKATAARDVPPGESWAFTDHRTMAEVIVDEATA